MFLQAGPAYVEAILSVLKNVSSVDTGNYTLSLLLQMLQGAVCRAA